MKNKCFRNLWDSIKKYNIFVIWAPDEKTGTYLKKKKIMYKNIQMQWMANIYNFKHLRKFQMDKYKENHVNIHKIKLLKDKNLQNK